MRCPPRCRGSASHGTHGSSSETDENHDTGRATAGHSVRHRTGYTRIGTGEGRKVFAGVMTLVSATWNIIDGLVAILDANCYESVASNAGIDLPVTDTIEAFA